MSSHSLLVKEVQVFKEIIRKIKKGIKSGQITASASIDPTLLGSSVEDRSRIKKKKDTGLFINIKF